MLRLIGLLMYCGESIEIVNCNYPIVMPLVREGQLFNIVTLASSLHCKAGACICYDA